MNPDSAWDIVRAAGPILASHTDVCVAAVVVALIGSVFAAGRAALTATPITRVSALLEDAKGQSRIALERYTRNPERVQSRWLAGRVVCTALTAALIAGAVAGLPLKWVVAIATLGTVVTYGALAEIGTTLASRNADRALPVLLRALRPLELVLVPLAIPLAAASKLVAGVLPTPSAPTTRTAEHEVELLLAEGATAGSLGKDRAEMIRKVLEFKDLTAGEVMVPRTSLTAVPANTALDEVLRIIAKNGHSRYPVYRGTVDNIVGLLYAKDLFRVMNDGDRRAELVEGFMRTPVNFVPETQLVSALLREMRARRLHMAVVVDDYGGVSGIVTLEDIIEEIVGDIQDEHDAEKNPLVALGEGHLLVDAAMPVDDLAKALGVQIPNEGDFVSVGGMLISRAGHVPAPGTEQRAYGLRFVVRDADRRKVSKVEVIREPAADERDAGDRDSPVPPAPLSS